VLSCESLTIFIVNDAGDRLEVAATTSIIWNVTSDEQHYRLNEGLTGTVWARRETLLSFEPAHLPGQKGKSIEAQSNTPKSFLWFPLLDASGEVFAIVRF